MAKTATKTALIPAPQISLPEMVEIDISKPDDHTVSALKAKMNSTGDAVVFSISMLLGSPVGEEYKNCGTIVLPDSVTIAGVEYWINLSNPWKYTKTGKRYKDGRPSIKLTPKNAKTDRTVTAESIPF